MKVDVIKDQKIVEPYAQIYTNNIDESIERVVKILETSTLDIVVFKEGKRYFIKPNDIYLIQTSQGRLIIHSKQDTYNSNKRLYEFHALLTSDFVQISKGSVINIRYVKSVETSLSGSLGIKMKNGLHDFIARRYVKAFKQHIGV